MTRSPNRLLGVILGGIFVVLGGLGFVFSSSVGFVDPAGVQFLGVLQVNGLQNSIHILVGAALVMAALSNQPASASTNAWTGTFLLVLGLVGLFLVGEPYNALALNSAANVLHFGAAAVLLAAGLGAENRPEPAPDPLSAGPDAAGPDAAGPDSGPDSAGR
ncbi:hypothetical protein BH10ACT7_BH10ACT7_16070 [soil metagenome]